MLYINNCNYSGVSGGYVYRVAARLASLQWTMLIFQDEMSMCHTLRTLIFPTITRLNEIG